MKRNQVLGLLVVAVVVAGVGWKLAAKDARQDGTAQGGGSAQAGSLSGVRVFLEPFPHIPGQPGDPDGLPLTDQWQLVAETPIVLTTSPAAILADVRAQVEAVLDTNQAWVELRFEGIGGTETVLDTVYLRENSFNTEFRPGYAHVVPPGAYTYRVYAKKTGSTVWIDDPGWLRVLVFDSPMQGDFDHDGDLDLEDYGQFSAAFTGPNP